MMSLKLPKALPLCPPRPKDCAIIMYTSGSTGNPKGVLLSHENMVSAMSALINIAQFRSKDRYIAYLPLAHVLELLAESSCLMFGIKIGYSSAQTLTNKSTKVKAGSKGDANFLKPTLMCAVPLILERIYKSIVDTMRRQGWAAEELFHCEPFYHLEKTTLACTIFLILQILCSTRWNGKTVALTLLSLTKLCFGKFDISLVDVSDWCFREVHRCPLTLIPSLEHACAYL